MKGANFSYPGVDVIDKLDYLEVPFLVKYVLSTYGNTNPYALLGPAVGFKLSAKHEIDEHGIASYEEDWEDVASTDVGIVFGLGFDISRLVFEVRYSLGVTSLDDSDEKHDIKNNAISLMAGFNIISN